MRVEGGVRFLLEFPFQTDVYGVLRFSPARLTESCPF